MWYNLVDEQSTRRGKMPIDVIGTGKKLMNLITESKSARLKLDNANLITQLGNLTVEKQKKEAQIKLLQAEKENSLVFNGGILLCRRRYG
jgi:regulator of replication initiation timing